MNIETNTTKCTSSTTHNIMMIIVECWGIPPRVGTTQPLTTETSRGRRHINPWPEHIKPCRQKLFSSQQTKNKALGTDLVQRYGTGNNVPVFYKGATTQDLMHKIPLNDGAWLDANVSDQSLVDQPEFLTMSNKTNSTQLSYLGRHWSFT